MRALARVPPVVAATTAGAPARPAALLIDYGRELQGGVNLTFRNASAGQTVTGGWRARRGRAGRGGAAAACIGPRAPKLVC